MFSANSGNVKVSVLKARYLCAYSCHRYVRNHISAVKSEELHCIDRTLVKVTADSVPKGRAVNGAANSNTAMVSVRQCSECLLFSVRLQDIYCGMSDVVT